MRKRLWIVLSLLVIVALLVGGCVRSTPPQPVNPSPASESPPSSQTPTPNPLNLSDPDSFPPDMLEVEWEASQPEFLSGEPVEIAISLTNVYDEPIVLNFPPEVLVLHHDMPGNTEDWTIRSYPSGTEQSIIEKGQAVTYQFVWDQKGDDGEQVTPGHYFIVVYERPVSQSGREGMSLGQEFEVFIQYKQGAMKKTIELNQSQTVSRVPLPSEDAARFTDLTVTLKRVELSEKRTQFLALATLPEYTWKSPYEHYPMYWMTADAEYVFDGTSKDAGCADEEASSEGIWLMWGYVNPRDQVPEDARELTFRVMIRFDEPKKWYGPWEFKVPLE